MPDWNISMGVLMALLGSLTVVFPGHLMTTSALVSSTLQHPDACDIVDFVAGLPMWQEPGGEVVLTPERRKGASVLILYWK
jgi:hypothetical protein